MSILVTGGTGNTGGPLAEFLREGGTDFRVACRNPGRDGIRFDWADPRTHLPALDGVERVYLVAPLGTTDPMPLAEPFLEAARKAGVRQLVLLSSLAVLRSAPGVADFHAAIRDFPEWVVLRPSGFMQNFTGNHPLAVGIREHGEIRTAAGDGRIGWIDAKDIAAVAAALLVDPARRREEHVLTGPDALSYAEAAAILGEVTGRRIRKADITVEQQARRYAAAGIPEPFAVALAGVEDDIRVGSEDCRTDAVRSLTGREPRSLRDFFAAEVWSSTACPAEPDGP